MRGATIAVLAVLAMMLTAPAAEAACPKTSLIAIQDEVMCVICGVPLVNAGGPQAEDLRNFIRERADKCESKEQIKTALVEEYGDAVLAVPRKSGFDLTAWIVPLVALLAALTAIVLGALRWSRARADGPTETRSGESSEALERDIQKYDL